MAISKGEILSALEGMSETKENLSFMSNPGVYSKAIEYYDWQPIGDKGAQEAKKKRFTSEEARLVTNFIRTHKPVWSHDLSSNLSTGEYRMYKSADWIAVYNLPGDKDHLLVIRGRFHPNHWKGDLNLNSYKVIPTETLGTIIEKEASRAEEKSWDYGSRSESLSKRALKLGKKAKRFKRKK